MATIGFTLPLRRANGGYFEQSTTLLEQVKSNFINLVLTIKGERPNNPEFGCDIHGLIFNFNNDDITSQAREAIDNAVQQWMPYITLEDFAVETTDGDRDRHTAKLYIRYRLTENPNLTDEIQITVWGI